MAMNRVQFQPGLSMIQFLDRYGTEDKCEVALVAARWPQGFACPDCGSGVQASAKLPQFKAVNTLLGNLKTALNGTYHAFDFAKYAHRYLAEAQYRFNRRFNLSAIMARLLRAASLTPPRPAPLIRLAEECR